jgi:TatD DNase family protein
MFEELTYAQAQQLCADQGLPGPPEPLPAPVIDAHTHVDSVLERSGLTADQSLALAQATGVTRLVQTGCDVARARFSEQWARQRPQVVATVSIHPNDWARKPDPGDFAVIEELAAAGPHVRAVGETGLDYFRTTDPAGQAAQRSGFAAHIELAARLGLTLVIHDRDAHDDILKVLDDAPAPPRVVMHCFSGDSDFAHQCVERGYWLSFPGVVTYKANHYLRRALAVTPDEQVLVETDAPYLTPVPARGKPNASYLIGHTVRFLADQRGWELAQACDRLSENAFAAFGGPWG